MLKCKNICEKLCKQKLFGVMYIPRDKFTSFTTHVRPLDIDR